MQIFAVANQKGGVGKTTTNVNISAQLAAMGKRVLTVDIDPQGNTTSGLGLDKKTVPVSIYDVLINDMPAQEAILDTTMPGLAIIAANINLAGAEIELVSALAREQILKNALATVSEQYDYCFIDCPPSLGLLTINALTAAQRLLVPIQCEYYALEGLSQLMNTVIRVRQSLNPSLEVEGVVLTMYDARTNLSLQVAGEVRQFFQSKVFTTLIPRNIRLAEAPSFGLPIVLYDPDSSGGQAYAALAQEFLAGRHAL